MPVGDVVEVVEAGQAAGLAVGAGRWGAVV